MHIIGNLYGFEVKLYDVLDDLVAPGVGGFPTPKVKVDQFKFQKLHDV
jgi:hypothetical protein